MGLCQRDQIGKRNTLLCSMPYQLETMVMCLNVLSKCMLLLFVSHSQTHLEVRKPRHH